MKKTLKKLLSLGLAALLTVSAFSGVSTPVLADTSAPMTIQSYELGDLNHNSLIDLPDAQITLKAALKITKLGTADAALADVNEDNSLTLKDAQLVLQKALKIINSYDDILVSKVTISQSSADLLIGDSLTLTASAFPTNAINNNIRWSTSNNKVATVYNGSVQAVGSGTATITASAGGYSATCTITVQTLTEKRLSTVKNTILNSGTPLSPTEAYIQGSLTLNGDTHYYSINYNTSTNFFLFKVTTFIKESYGTITCDVTMPYSGNGSSSVNPNVYITMPDVQANANSTFNSNSYTETRDVYFHLDYATDGSTEAEVQEVCNAALKFGFASWDHLLNEKCGFGMNSIGFSSYY